MADIADGTGGIFFHNSNDLNERFRWTADAPEFMHVLGFSPQKLDEKFYAEGHSGREERAEADGAGAAGVLRGQA